MELLSWDPGVDGVGERASAGLARSDGPGKSETRGADGSFVPCGHLISELVSLKRPLRYVC